MMRKVAKMNNWTFMDEICSAFIEQPESWSESNLSINHTSGVSIYIGHGWDMYHIMRPCQYDLSRSERKRLRDVISNWKRTRIINALASAGDAD
jgi:hypothetical protein